MIYLLVKLFEKLFLSIFEKQARKNAIRCVDDIDTELLNINKENVVDEYGSIRSESCQDIIKRFVVIAISALFTIVVWMLYVNSTYTFGFNFVTIVFIVFVVNNVIDIIVAGITGFMVIKDIINMQSVIKNFNSFHERALYLINSMNATIYKIIELDSVFGNKSLTVLKKQIAEYTDGDLFDATKAEYFITMLEFFSLANNSYLKRLVADKEKKEKEEQEALLLAEQEKEAKRIENEVKAPIKSAPKPTPRPAARPVVKPTGNTNTPTQTGPVKETPKQ